MIILSTWKSIKKFSRSHFSFRAVFGLTKYFHRQSLCIGLLCASDPRRSPTSAVALLGVLCSKTSSPGSLCAAMRKSFALSFFYIDFIWPDPRAIFVRRPFTLFMLILADFSCFVFFSLLFGKRFFDISWFLCVFLQLQHFFVESQTETWSFSFISQIAMV